MMRYICKACIKEVNSIHKDRLDFLFDYDSYHDDCPGLYDEDGKYICEYTEERGHIDCVSDRNEWRGKTLTKIASRNGHIECLIYAHKNGCKLHRSCAAIAAENRHFECLIYAYKNGCKLD